jgi:hypothetical protein
MAPGNGNPETHGDDGDPIEHAAQHVEETA